MQPDLPESYYLDNVITLFDHVESLYADLLEQEQLEFLHSFATLSSDAQKLYIRLLNRSHYLFRLSKLDYPEIGSIPNAIALLSSRGFLQVDPEINRAELIALFSKTELLAQHPQRPELRKMQRSALDTALLNENEDIFFNHLKKSDCLLQVLQKDSYTLFQMLFFGNLNQSMTDFVLRDIGLYCYENYHIDMQNRPYTSTPEIQQHWLLHQVDTLFQLTDPADQQTLQTCFNAVAQETSPDSPLYRKAERIKFEVARQIERLGDLPLALALYCQCSLPPSRERIARIWHKQGEVKAALKFCETIIDTPYSEEETQFAFAFGRRLVQRHKISDHAFFSAPEVVHKPEILELELAKQDSVEIAVAEYFREQNSSNQCFYLENSLFNGILGLIIWDAIFAPIAGAFYNPFQHRPADYYAHDFKQKRALEFEAAWSSITTNEHIWQRVAERWAQKFGMMNPLVNWQALSLEIIELALQRIPFNHWTIIFERIQLDLRNNRAGFPDLVLFPADDGYQLVEVKGPGDSLQKNQQRWMNYFVEHDIPHTVARVRWADAI